MYYIFEVQPKRGGKFKVKFLKENIYKIIRSELNIFYLQSNEGGRYVKKVVGGFDLFTIQDVRDEFRAFFEKNYEKIENRALVTLFDFREEFFRQRPIRDNNIIRNRLMLRDELTTDDKIKLNSKM